MTSSTASNPIIASLARNSPSHRSILTTPRSVFRSRSTTGQSRRVRSVHRRMSTSSAAPVTMPVVDLNNNSNIAMPVAAGAPVTPITSSPIALDRVAILKVFMASQANAESSESAPAVPATERASRFEKPTSYREARRRKHRSASLSDPAIEQELVRLRESVPSIAGSNVSDLTIINEAISLICDLESQLIRKLKCQSLPAQLQQHLSGN